MNKSLASLLVFLLALVWSGTAHAQSAPPIPVKTELQGLTVETTVDRESLEVGEVLVVRVAWTGLGSASARLSSASSAEGSNQATIGEWDLLSVKPSYTPSGARNGLELKLSTLDASAALPSIPLAWEADGSQTGSALVQAVTVRSIVGEEADPASFRDIAGAVEVRDRRLSTKALIIAVVVAIVAALLAGYLLRGRRPPRIELPHERALRELEELERAGLSLSGGSHAFYIALTNTVRRYVTDRFSIGATRWTTREFTTHARASGDFSDAQVDRLTALLRLADFVKFAGAQADAHRAGDDVAAARAFVTETIPVLEAKSAGGTQR